MTATDKRELERTDGVATKVLIFNTFSCTDTIH
jgi:hypothetical protein